MDGRPGLLVLQVVLEQGYPPAWSHHLDPQALAGLAVALYDAAPPMAVVSVTTTSFAAGDQLSATLQRALPQVVDTVAQMAEEHAAS